MHELQTEPIPNQPDTLRSFVIFRDIQVPINLYTKGQGGELRQGGSTDILVVIPVGYPQTKLDCWYCNPYIHLANGELPDRANGTDRFIGKDWQFWSRHLEPSDWRPGVDGLEVYRHYILDTLAKT